MNNYDEIKQLLEHLSDDERSNVRQVTVPSWRYTLGQLGYLKIEQL